MAEEIKDKIEEKEEGQSQTDEENKDRQQEGDDTRESSDEEKEILEEVKKQANKKSGKKSKAEELEDEVEELKSKNEDLRDKYLRLFADFDNYKKRVAKEKLEMLNEAGKEVIADLLPVLDDFDRALKTIEESEDVEAVKQGSELIFQKLKKVLEQKGLKEMESIGKDFDSEYHEAITEIQAPSKDQKGKVIDEVEKGYYLNEKIIRYAKVVVGK